MILQIHLTRDHVICKNIYHVRTEVISLMSGMYRAEANIALACFSKPGEFSEKNLELPREKNFLSCSFEVVRKSGYIQP